MMQLKFHNFSLDVLAHPFSDPPLLDSYSLAHSALISLLRVVPFIVTLGTMTVYLGVGKIISDETTIYPSRDKIPDWLGSLCSTLPPDSFARRACV